MAISWNITIVTISSKLTANKISKLFQIFCEINNSSQTRVRNMNHRSVDRCKIYALEPPITPVEQFSAKISLGFEKNFVKSVANFLKNRLNSRNLTNVRRCQGLGPILGPGVLWAPKSSQTWTTIFGEFWRQLGIDFNSNFFSGILGTLSTLNLGS